MRVSNNRPPAYYGIYEISGITMTNAFSDMLDIIGSKETPPKFDSKKVASSVGLAFLPDSYLNFVRTIGKGVLDNGLYFGIPKCPENGVQLEHIIAENRDLHLYVNQYSKIKIPEGLVVFGMHVDAYSVAWDVRSPLGAEYPIVMIDGKDSRHGRVGSDLYEFIKKYWIGQKALRKFTGVIPTNKFFCGSSFWNMR